MASTATERLAIGHKTGYKQQQVAASRRNTEKTWTSPTDLLHRPKSVAGKPSDDYRDDPDRLYLECGGIVYQVDDQSGRLYQYTSGLN